MSHSPDHSPDRKRASVFAQRQPVRVRSLTEAAADVLTRLTKPRGRITSSGAARRHSGVRRTTGVATTPNLPMQGPAHPRIAFASAGAFTLLSLFGLMWRFRTRRNILCIDRADRIQHRLLISSL